tara:strand:- start:254 stop:1354 length:1101 start_codon:yes stop_codon:yes gene_type:complete
VAKNLNIPYFGTPPAQYAAPYFADMTRAFSLFAQQMVVPGPERATSLTLTTTAGGVATGQLSYNSAEDTIDLTHLNGVTQQIGFETYMRVNNDTGVTIPDGVVVGFTGVNGEIKVSPYIADGSAPELYFVGVTTFEMVDEAIGPVTVYGKVRGLDTTGTAEGEVWLSGDILYASPTVAGAFTKVRPTAPQSVIAVAAVLVVDATAGEIMVRPTIPIGLNYGSFDSTTTQTLATADTATAVTLQTTLSATGMSIGTPTSRIVAAAAGFYQVSASVQFTSTNASAKTLYLWLSKNGTNVVDTTRAYTIKANGDTRSLSVTYSISLAAGDYIELKWAATDTGVTLSATTGLGFAPDVPSALVSVAQIQL